MYQDHFGLRFHGEWDDADRTVFAGLSSRCFVSAVGKRQTLASSHVLIDLLCWIFASFRFTFLSVSTQNQSWPSLLWPITHFLSHILTIHQSMLCQRITGTEFFYLLSKFTWIHLWIAVHIQQLLFITALLQTPVSILVTWTFDQVISWWTKAFIFFSCWIKYLFRNMSVKWLINVLILLWFLNFDA